MIFHLCFFYSVLDSDTKLELFGRALKSQVRLDPLDLLGKKYKVLHTRKHIQTVDLIDSLLIVPVVCVTGQ